MPNIRCKLCNIGDLFEFREDESFDLHYCVHSPSFDREEDSSTSSLSLSPVYQFSDYFDMNYGHPIQHHMGDPTGMLHYGMYEKPKPKFLFKVPRVVPDQKAKFESDELFRRLSRESEIRYTGGRDRGKEERQSRFQRDLHDGHTEVAFVTNGLNVHLAFSPPTQDYNMQDKQCDFDKEPGKVHIRSSFIMNGVCVRWRGWIDLERLDGVACLEYDEELGAKEDAKRDNYMKMR